MTILQDVNKTETETLQAVIARLQAENAALKQAKSNGNWLKVSEKGALSVYGLGRFPVTLYRSQWEKLFAKVDEMKAFITANADKLTEKA
jgi:hypothetical protein